ncbi:beta-galactosidase [Haloferula luteola]|uniref:Beta-galactosidase n=1 Tax=Haloferula luteola TaxID=595692 RepID=A0A840VHI4_9BACT|nr:sugar-binding domain-containing protein [Haloferula luteola]MBB5353300.1 beta-galactosidase [Haloferula luteola]
MKTNQLLLACLGATLCLPAQADWKPVEGRIMTDWAKKLDPSHVWDEYPRPLLERDAWTNLNGLWDYQVASKEATQPGEWDGQILVPFAPEAALSGVGRIIEADQALWYRRSMPAPAAGKRSLLHFEAVDYDTTVWVNGQEIGQHRGGNTPFDFDITDALKADGNELVVRCYDATEEYQLNGKQRRKAEGIFYTRVSGIWQTVWLENVPARSLADLDFSCDISKGSITVTPKLSGPALQGEKLRVTALDGGKEVATAEGSSDLTLTIPGAKLWSPKSPSIYDLKVELLDGEGKVVDTAKSYTALRKVGKIQDTHGHWRFTLNDQIIYHWGPLDQGWWPDGLLTPPSDEAMVSDIEFLHDAGFNMIRKHIKVEPRRYYMHCDRLGMMLWQDQVSGGPSPRWTRFDANPEDASWPAEHAEQWVVEYKRMVDHLRDHPSIVVWTPFNEAWGQHDTVEMGKMAIDYDKTRLINIASGGNFWEVGDIADEHRYPHPGYPFDQKRLNDYIKVVGEFGGHGFPVKDHLWNPDANNWGYGGLPKDIDEWKSRYRESIVRLAQLRKQGVAAGVYTQTTDVEGEINGLLTYDRQHKVETAWLRKLSDMLLNTPDVVERTALIPSAAEASTAWKFTEQRPAQGWRRARFNDDSWGTSDGGFGSKETPNAPVKSEWKSSDIWLRKTFEAEPTAGADLVMDIFHDENAQVFLNGKKIADLKGHVSGYTTLAIEDSGVLKAGTNILAVHCHQTTGGQFIDIGLYLEKPKD